MPHKKKSVDELAEEAGGMYALVVAVAKRAKQLKEGRARVSDCPSANVLTVAIQEMREGKVVIRPPGEREEGAESEATTSNVTVTASVVVEQTEVAEVPEEEAPAEEAPNEEAPAEG